MARTPVMAAGGIVMRRELPPLIAVVRVRKRDEWVLPKGKLDDGETPRDAARREVLEETGHNVTVHEFLGTLVYDSGGRSKVVHYWRMEAGGTQARELTNDVRAVDWLPLDAAIERLSRDYERTFLENVGPVAVGVLSRRLKAAKTPAAAKALLANRRRARPTIAPQPPAAAPVSHLPMPAELMPEPTASDAVADLAMQATTPDTRTPASAGFIPQGDGTDREGAFPSSRKDDRSSVRREPHSLVQKVRNWFGRVA
jgi:8-oxo-dGTP diphosphatase